MARKDATNIFTFEQLRKEGILQNFKKSQFQSTEMNRQKRKLRAVMSGAGLLHGHIFSLQAVRGCVGYAFPGDISFLTCVARTARRPGFCHARLCLTQYTLVLPSCIFPVLLLKLGLLLNSLCGYTVTHFTSNELGQLKWCKMQVSCYFASL